MGWMIVLGVCLKCVWVCSGMSVGPTRGLAERGRPFFRHTFLEWGRGRGWPGWLPSCPPAPSPAREVIAPPAPASLSNGCQV